MLGLKQEKTRPKSSWRITEESGEREKFMSFYVDFHCVKARRAGFRDKVEKGAPFDEKRAFSVDFAHAAAFLIRRKA